MENGKKRKNGADALRKRAEEKIGDFANPEGLSLEDTQRLVHELKVHQIELEMQNETLRQAQIELMEAYEKYIDLYDFAPVGYLSLDENGAIQEANLTVARQLGVERASLAGLIFVNFVAPSDKQAFRAHLAQLFKAGQPGTLETRLVTKKQGSEFYASIHGMFVESSHGKKQGRISVADISERKKAEQTAKVYMNNIEQSNKQLQEFAFIASHDLQEPLRKIRAFGDQIRRKYANCLDDEGRDYLDRMIIASSRMSDMIRGLLDYSRVSTGAKQTGTVDLTRVAKEVASDLEIVIKNNDASVEVENLPSVEADPIQMRQLFQNLMSNALKFHGEKNPVVKIFARTAGNTSHDIFIEDNGIGFEERDLDRIFTLFQRLHGRSAYEGRGIGLAICRKIVERHHGSITARSKPGQGATFIVTLPEKQPSESDASVM